MYFSFLKLVPLTGFEPAIKCFRDIAFPNMLQGLFNRIVPSDGADEFKQLVLEFNQ